MDALHRRGMIPPPPPLGFVDQYPIYMVQPLVNTDFAISQDWPVNEPHDEHTHEEPGDDHWVLTDEALSFFKESAARRKNSSCYSSYLYQILLLLFLLLLVF
eukprot:TRINITY_DN1718_c0_g1_i2.p1 TRINITY_DN1718_c0_g1~~TRINITY_DN1718_c0_g1_i2.p1  ORF type:complete len:102 (-),score=16.40 TRINITY_DN1718_c0_g1_i2:345-650(-)